MGKAVVDSTSFLAWLVEIVVFTTKSNPLIRRANKQLSDRRDKNLPNEVSLCIHFGWLSSENSSQMY